MSLIELKNLTIGHGSKVAARDINASIENGDFVCIVGPNGAGKSTLVQTILGDIQLINGKVVMEGISRQEIGFIAQDFAPLADFPATVEEIVLSGTLNQLKHKWHYDTMARKKAASALKTMRLSALSKSLFAELSGGQKQKTLLARALAATSKLLILDEPSNNLDRKSVKELYQTLTKLNQEGITIIMITHDLDHGNLIGNKILSLSDEVFYGSVSDFVRKVHHE